MGKTVITITNLPSRVSELFGGKTTAILDLPDKYSIRLSKSVEQLSILNKITVEGALGFSAPYSKVNDRVFAEYATPVTLNVTTVFFNCQVVVDGHPLQFSRLFVRGKNDKTKEWELELARSPDHWVELSSTVKINELDFGTFQMNAANIIASWSSPSYEGDYTDISTIIPVAWPLIDYGNFVDQSQPPQGTENRVKSVAVEDFRPWLSFIYILQAGFCKIGWTLESVLFETDVIKKLWIYALRPDYYIASNDQRGGRVTGQIYTQALFNQGNFLLLDYVKALADYQVIDTSSGVQRYCGVKNYPGVALKYRFFFKGDFFNNRTLPFSAFFSVMEIEDTGPGGYQFTGEILSDESLQVDFAAGETKSVTFDQTVTLKAGQMAAIHIPVLPMTTPGFFINAGFYFEVSPANDSYMTDDVIDVRLSVSDSMSILDALKSFVHLVNGRLSTDWETKTVTIYPNKTSNVWGETSPGFLLVEEPIIDIDNLIQPDSIIQSPVRPDLKRFTVFGFAESTDAYIDSLNLLEPAHSRKLLNSNDLPNETEYVLNPFLQPTLEGQPKFLASRAGNRSPVPYLARLWDNTSNERSFSIAPRVLYAYGPVKQIKPAPITSANEFTSFYLNNEPNLTEVGAIDEFGYFTQSPTWELTPTPTQVVDVVFGVKSSDLFTTFYLGYTQDNRSGTLIDLLMSMTFSSYAGYNFRNLFRLKIRGMPIVASMVDIRDFSSAENIATPVSFFVPPAVLDCCDLPCGCQFIECDYYQDFGPHLRQSTLDDMLLESFEIDGIELLSSPVVFGTIKIIDIGGKPYVTNLVDVLNSVGAPYFSFDYSTRIHPEKGLRFFTLKRLICHEFRILISISGSDAYEYTQSSQLQKIFSGTWDPMGYGSEFVSIPENCQQTTEY